MPDINRYIRHGRKLERQNGQGTVIVELVHAENLGYSPFKILEDKLAAVKADVGNGIRPDVLLQEESPGFEGVLCQDSFVEKDGCRRDKERKGHDEQCRVGVPHGVFKGLGTGG